MLQALSPSSPKAVLQALYLQTASSARDASRLARTRRQTFNIFLSVVVAAQSVLYAPSFILKYFGIKEYTVTKIRSIIPSGRSIPSE
jgi:hypothetical protein